MAERKENKGFTTATVSAEEGTVSLEYQRYGRNKSTVINKTYIESGEFRRKFDRVTEDANLSRLLYNKAKEMLYHRSGTEYEDMYWIDPKTYCCVAAITDMMEIHHIEYDEKTEDKIYSYDRKSLIAMHTHPNSGPPSIEDLNSSYSHGYKYGIVVCHNGTIFVYSAEEELSKRLYELYCSEFVDAGMTEYNARVNALKEMERNYRFAIREV